MIIAMYFWYKSSSQDPTPQFSSKEPTDRYDSSQ